MAVIFTHLVTGISNCNSNWQARVVFTKNLRITLTILEYKSGAYPLLLDNWAEEYPLIVSANAPVFYAWIGGSATNTFHEAVQENEYFTDDSGIMLLKRENVQILVINICFVHLNSTLISRFK